MADSFRHITAHQRRVLLVTPANTGAGDSAVGADEPLDDVGRVEALALAETLSYTGPQCVITSPLARARATAEVIANHARVPLILDSRLRDRAHAGAEGRTLANAPTGGDVGRPGVEPADSVLRRTRAVLDEQLHGAEDAGPVVLVTHHQVARLLIGALDPEHHGRIESPQRAATWTVLAAEGRHWQVLDADEPPTQAEPGE